MGEDEAEQVASALRRRGLRGVAAPQDPDHPEGEWRVYDGTDPVTRRDITDEARAATTGVPGKTGPTRGFVLPSAP
ncbi:hypothetical protein UK12_16945 [Saccharothrix sp. ST-888]|nr:hypothetical protein UK12_16945 [Saccharothrix sp. ST-888]